jgi:hypothetical protein
MRERLESVREALDSNPQYRRARPRAVAALLGEAESCIKQANAIFQRKPKLSGDAFVAFDRCLKLARRDMELACRDPAVVLGTIYWRQQTSRGKKGAAVRWLDQGIINELYRKYAKHQDGLGGLSLPGDIYESFAGDCRDAGIKPPLKKTFRNRLSEVRNELNLK